MFKSNSYKKRLKNRCFLNGFKRQKSANCIVIGGMIASGKSTLVKNLCDKYNFKPIYELSDDKNDLMHILLDKMYQRGEKIAESVCQLHFILNRYQIYKESCEHFSSEMKVFDRSIFEDRLFAFHNMLDQPSVFEYYERLWREKVQELIYNIGTPKLYVIINVSWDTFLKRLYSRNRNIEINNFEKNKEYFQLLNKCYCKYLINICNTYRIPYLIIDGELDQDSKIKIVANKLKEIKIIN